MKNGEGDLHPELTTETRGHGESRQSIQFLLRASVVTASSVCHAKVNV